MQSIHRKFALLLGFVALNAMARPPEPGVWHNPNEPGRGWILEGQNDLWIIAHFNYTAAGDSAFFTTLGTWNETNDTIEGALLAPDGGQCIGCTYRAPTQPSVGTVRFEFISTTQGFVRYSSGVSVPIERFHYGFGTKLDQLLGTWSVVWYGVPATAGFPHSFYLKEVTTIGSTTAADGETVDYNRGRRVAGGYLPSGNLHFVLIDATTSFYDYLYFRPENEVLWGIGCTGRKTDPAPSLTSCLGLVDGVRKLTLPASRARYSVAENKFGLSNATVDDTGDLQREQLQLTPEAGESVRAFQKEITPYADELTQAMDTLRRDFERAREKGAL